MTEQSAAQFGKRKKWIMCPTCRQRTDIENVAFVVEKAWDKPEKSTEDLAESTISVQGSLWNKGFMQSHYFVGVLSVLHLNPVVTAYFSLQLA